MKPKPYTPRPWQLPHLAATPVGGKVLIVERCKEQDWIRPALGNDGIAHGYCGSGPDGGEACPLGPVGTADGGEG